MKRINVNDIFIRDSKKTKQSKNVNKYTADTSTPKNQKDVNALIKQALYSPIPVPNDIKIDDGDIKQAKNFFHFASSKKFMNESLYAKQMEMGIKLFGEYNPRLTNMDWFNNIPVDATYDDFRENVSFLKHGKCPKTKVTKSELIKLGEINPYTSLVSCWGQRSGKSYLNQLIPAYMTHGILKLQSPGKVFGLSDKGSLLTGSMISLTFAQAKNNLYIGYYEKLLNSPFFQEYHAMLDYYGKKYGEQLYKFNDTFVHYRTRDFMLIPSGPDKRILRGATRIFYSIDEADWMFSAGSDGGTKSSKNSIKYNIKEIVASLSNSMQTIIGAWRTLIKKDYYGVLQPVGSLISSPSSKYGIMMTTYEKSKRSKTILGSHLATWEVNPNLNFDDLYEEIATQQGEEVFYRDFGASPPLSSASFISDVADFKHVVNKELSNAFILTQTTTGSEKRKRKGTSGSVKFNDFLPATRCLAIDAGEVDNSFAIATGFNYYDKQSKSFIPVIDGLGELFPSHDKPANFTQISKTVISPIIKKMEVVMMVSDRWQSTKLLSDIEEEFNISTEKYSLKYADFSNFREDLYSESMITPKPELKPSKIESVNNEDYPDAFIGKPIAHFIFQGLTVRDNSGKGVSKGENLTDDLFRAVVLLHSYLTDPEYREMFTSGYSKPKNRVSFPSLIEKSYANTSGGQMNGLVNMSAGMRNLPSNANPVYSRGR